MPQNNSGRAEGVVPWAQSQTFISAAGGLPSIPPASAPSNTLPALSSSLAALTPLSAKAAQSAALAGALTSLQASASSPLLQNTSDTLKACVSHFDALLCDASAAGDEVHVLYRPSTCANSTLRPRSGTQIPTSLCNDSTMEIQLD